jgi:hypothetical protein
MTRQRQIEWIRTIRRSVPVVLFAVALAAGPQALAQMAGAIQGKVVNGTEKGAVAGIEVSLEMFSQTEDLGTRTATTDEAGAFAFTDLPADLAGYQIVVPYGGAEYRSVATAYTSGQAVSETVRVYEPTGDPTDVTLSSYIVWIDREGDGVAVQHDFSWTNDGDTAYVGTDGATTIVPLPDGATSFQFLGTFLESPGDVKGQRYVSDAPILPGDTAATLRYNAPPLTQLRLEMPFETTSLQFFVPQDVQVSSSGLRLAGTITDQGQDYSVYAADDLAAGATIDIAMSQTATSGSKTGVLLIVLIALLAVAIVAGLVGVILRRRHGSRRAHPSDRGREPKRSPARPRAQERPAPAATSVGAQGNGKAVHDAEPEDPDLIIDEIAALDLSFERGLLDERTYKRLRVAAKDRLLRAQGARADGGRR